MDFEDPEMTLQSMMNYALSHSLACQRVLHIPIFG